MCLGCLIMRSLILLHLLNPHGVGIPELADKIRLQAVHSLSLVIPAPEHFDQNWPHNKPAKNKQRPGIKLLSDNPGLEIFLTWYHDNYKPLMPKYRPIYQLKNKDWLAAQAVLPSNPLWRIPETAARKVEGDFSAHQCWIDPYPYNYCSHCSMDKQGNEE